VAVAPRWAVSQQLVAKRAAVMVGVKSREASRAASLLV